MAFTEGWATVLAHSPTGSTYTDIGQVKDVNLSMEVGSTETTNLASTGKEYIPTIPGMGEMSFTIQYDAANATHQTLTGLVSTPVVAFWKITLSDGTTIVYQGFLTKFDISGIEAESVVESSVSIQPTGLPTITPPA